jgi:hypothetical protein
MNGRTGFRALMVAALLSLNYFSPAFAQKEPERTGGPFVPTPQVVVDQMLRMGKVGPEDFVIDLGSGDGVIVLTAATRYKARGMGVDIDPALVKLSNGEAKRLGLADRVSFRVEDVMKTDISRATVLTLYLLPGMMLNLRSKIYSELKPGTRVVSHDYNFDEWRPDDSITFDAPEKERVNGIGNATVMLWIVPAKVAGNWQVRVDGVDAHRLALRQTYQLIDGTASTNGRSGKLLQPTLKGEEIAFQIVSGTSRQVYQGRVTGDTMQGTADVGGRTAQWTAARSPAVSAMR